MFKLRYFFVFLIPLLLSFTSVTSEVKAWSCGQGCTFSTQCSSCCDPGDNSCSYSCLSNNSTYGVKRCVRSVENTANPQCNPWCGWSPCNGGFRTRDCCDGIHNEFQIEACTTPTNAGGGGGSTGCTVNSAVVSPSTVTVTVGSSTTLTMTTSDSPSGCTGDGNFVKSNNNVTITSTNPDTSIPFTAVVRCDAAGTTTITGQALVGGAVRASDSMTITCQAPIVCTRGSWTNGSCGAGGCSSTQRQQTRTVSPAGCDINSQCVTDATCGPVPTIPPGCTTGSWTNGACGGGACANNQREQTRTTSPAGCTQSTQCVADASCITSCTTSSWSNGACGGGSCSATQRQQTRTVSPGGCTTTSQCIDDASCGPVPTVPAGCTTGSWTNGSCGGGACNNTQREQTRTTSPAGCTSSSRCVADASCNTAASPTPTITPNPTATPTPTPPACAAPRPKDPPTLTCGSPGTIKWEWNDVSGVNQYNLVIQQFSGGIWNTIYDSGWVGASNFGCQGDGTGTCTRSDVRNPGTYRSRVRARNSNTSACTASAFNTSAQVNLYDCTSISIPPIVLNGAPSSQTVIVTTSNMPPGGTITFTIDNPAIATANPPADSSSPYQTLITSITTGETYYTASTVDYYGNPVTDTSTIKVINPTPWCQGKEGDILVKTNIFCNIPAPCSLEPLCSPFVIKSDTGEAPGAAIAGQSFSAGTGQASTNPYNFKVTGDEYLGKEYDYSYLDNKVSGMNFGSVSGTINNVTTLTSGTVDNGFVWKKSSGSLTIGGNLNLGDDRVVLFVNGDLNINGVITLDDGRGFFMAVVKGNINVSPNVHDLNAFRTRPDNLPELEGIYFAEGDFISGTAGDDSDQQLHVRGVVAAGGFQLQRDLPDNSSIPSEYFEYGADQVLRLPAALSKKQVIWKEVAP